MKPRLATALLASAAALAMSAGSSAVAAADEPVSCDAVASPSGSDSAPGTVEQPVRTAMALLGVVPSGGTACLRAGTYAQDDEIKISASNVTLTSYPGEAATLKGRLWIAGDNDTVTGLALDGVNSNRLPSPSISGDRDVVSDNDITNDNTSICVSLGALDYGIPNGTLIENNRIHDCGRRPATNQDHGIYVAYGRNTEIRGNYIFDNADRGIQLYPDAQGTHVDHNIIDGNGEGVIFGGDSSNNTIENNIISNSRIRFNVESYWDGAPGHDNNVSNNCLWNGEQGNVMDPSVGFNAWNNEVARPDLSNLHSASFKLASNDPCAGVLAGGDTPGGGHQGGSPGQPGTSPSGPAPHLGVGLRVAHRRVAVSHPINFRGLIHNGRTESSRAIIETRRNGRWQRVALSPISGGQRFSASVRVSATTHRSHVYRAVVPGVGHSTGVHVQVKRG